MLIVVKPGIVLISLTNHLPDLPSSRKSTRPMPAPSMAAKRLDGQPPHFGGLRRRQRRRDLEPRAVVQVLRLVVVELP